MPNLVNLSPIAQLLLIGAALATLALVPVLRRRQRGEPPARTLRALTLVTLFLTFDLVLFGAFTRLSDSGLGCPDWPGCYGSTSPAGAHAQISQAQAALPTGPVTHGKAWIEMTHRYLATAVGALITAAMAWSAWLARRGRDTGISPAWALLSFVWVCAQGAFGALTVTMKLYPAIVTAHLLGGIGLLALLAVQWQRFDVRPVALPAALRTAAWGLFGLVVVQVALGGWVSTNYAVLACSDFPTCQGQWWPPATARDFADGFTLRRELGQHADGQLLSFAALTAIHWTHRLGAAVVLSGMLALAVALWRQHDASARRHARGLAALALWQLASGISNVVLGWPLLAALAHTGGAAVLVALLASLLARTSPRVVLLPVPSAPPSLSQPA